MTSTPDLSCTVHTIRQLAAQLWQRAMHCDPREYVCHMAVHAALDTVDKLERAADELERPWG